MNLSVGYTLQVPIVSRFFGILIQMYYREHGVPHFHAVYGEDRASFAIDSLDLLEGGVPRRVRALVLEWAADHRAELVANWERARQHEPLVPIAPLE